ncbi:hypothetical protein SPFM12_00278 [Salmonella phage SPFM12]|nr:hypothetical protein SPFM12_00278 [Salmonella phage SPFM12]
MPPEQAWRLDEEYIAGRKLMVGDYGAYLEIDEKDLLVGLDKVRAATIGGVSVCLRWNRVVPKKVREEALSVYQQHLNGFVQHPILAYIEGLVARYRYRPCATC